jgi:hypothetical protein
MYAQARVDGDSKQPPEDTNVSHLPVGAQKKAQKKAQRSDRQTQERDATHTLQSRLSSAAITDIGMDPFEVTTVRGTVFAWRTIYRQMVSHDVVVMNWPKGVRAPILMRPGRSASALNKAERQLLMAAIDAREGGRGQGLHFIKRVYTDGTFFFGSDYCLGAY